MFTGAGGLDLGFERQGFRFTQGIDIDPWCVRTLKLNRPDWDVVQGDARCYAPALPARPDVLLAGLPCQGFSLGGRRDERDIRNTLYAEVIRVARAVRPRVVVVENVTNLRSMRAPASGRPFLAEIARALAKSGYSVRHDLFNVSRYGVPQTRRRVVIIGFLGGPPRGYQLPAPGPVTSVRAFLDDLAHGGGAGLPNHDARWGYKSRVHTESGEPTTPDDEVVPIRLSRTASDGHPARSLDDPFPAVDTGTIWGWAQGRLRVARVEKDREHGTHVRNRDARVTLWRISASRLRAFTHREYARLQTFPDDWVFAGGSKRDINLQIGNAVPVRFAEHLAENVRRALRSLDLGTDSPQQLHTRSRLAAYGAVAGSRAVNVDPCP